VRLSAPALENLFWSVEAADSGEEHLDQDGDTHRNNAGESEHGDGADDGGFHERENGSIARNAGARVLGLHNLKKDRSLLDAFARGDEHGGNAPGPRREEVGVHLHRLDGRYLGAFLDRLVQFHIHRHNFSGEWTRDVAVGSRG